MAMLGDNDVSGLIDAATRVDRERKRNFATQLRRSGADALGFGDDLLALFTTLPAAVIASEQAEYKRIVERYGEKHPRALQVAAALADVEDIEAQAERGRARAARAIESVQASGPLFFGFVTGSDGTAQAGYKVRLTGDNLPAGKLEGATEKDGYFRIALPGAGTTAQRASSKRAAPAAAKDGTADSGPLLANVEILDRRGTSVYQDPLPLRIDAGSAYREYQLDGAAPASDKSSARTKARSPAKAPKIRRPR